MNDKDNQVEQLLVGAIVALVAIVFSGCIVYGLYAHKHAAVLQARRISQQIAASALLFAGGIALLLFKTLHLVNLNQRMVGRLCVRHLVGILILNFFVVALAHISAPLWSKFFKTSGETNLRENLY
jgi:hypothetical protein